MIIRTLEQQVELWFRSALFCYGLDVRDVRLNKRNHMIEGALVLLRTKTPKDARDYIFNRMEHRYHQLSGRHQKEQSWDRLIKEPANERD